MALKPLWLALSRSTSQRRSAVSTRTGLLRAETLDALVGTLTIEFVGVGCHVPAVGSGFKEGTISGEGIE